MPTWNLTIFFKTFNHFVWKKKKKWNSKKEPGINSRYTFHHKNLHEIYLLLFQKQ